ncbi:MAG TPA: glycosyltransferase family 4 protein [Chloroflexota bacterium]
MKVCLLTDELSFKHGWGRYSIALIRALLNRGTDLRILSPKHLCTEQDLLDHPDHHEVSSFLWETRSLARTSLANFLAVRRLVEGCDVVHCITEPYAPVAALAGGRRPLYVTAHGTYSVHPLASRKDGPLLRFAYRRARRVLCVSRYTEGRLKAAVPWVRAGTVPEGVDFDRFQIPVDQSTAPDVPYLLSVGPIKERKGYAVSLAAFALLRDEFPDLHYYVVGMVHEDGFHRHLLEMASEAGIVERVHFLGQVPDEQLIALYRGCRLFALTPQTVGTQFEGFGLIYLEANACGKPVVGSRGCGAEEAIVDGKTGFLVPGGDAGATAEAMRRLLRDPGLAAKMGSTGRERARLKSWDVTAGKVLEQYGQETAG